MGLVANYGSGSDTEASEEEEDKDTTMQPMQSFVNINKDINGAESFTPEVVSSLLSKLPAPKVKKTVQYKLPMNTDLLRKGTREDSPPRKIQRVVKSGMSLKDLLPKPKFQEETLGGALGGGSKGGVMLDLGGGEECAEGSLDLPSSAPARPACNPYGIAPQVYGSQQVQQDGPGYIMEHELAHQASPSSHALGGQLPTSFFQEGRTPGEVYNGATSLPLGPSLPARPTPQAPSQDQLLSQAMQEEVFRRNRTGKRGLDPFKKMEMPQMMEVAADSLTELTRPVDPMSETGKAFGPQYAAELKKQAGAKPDKQFRRKHQIGSLYYDAKVRELELLENRAKGMKSRSETQGKYGW
eukprot:CAMPEP_0196594082 /NCGR_PEP_ID=MMETSP1081-20130531/77323_1 /TAXON_ID=36882 /ORGANISM="Pyramimonas amylifera, Strain CCMP720" /LENGTH=353 /DNA_ID=CAMNT_0041918243 /DNA_START=214 /DNA_END=1272 /DNA_ORIENTATION=-